MAHKVDMRKKYFYKYHFYFSFTGLIQFLLLRGIRALSCTLRNNFFNESTFSSVKSRVRNKTGANWQISFVLLLHFHTHNHDFYKYDLYNSVSSGSCSRKGFPSKNAPLTSLLFQLVSGMVFFWDWHGELGEDSWSPDKSRNYDEVIKVRRK